MGANMKCAIDGPPTGGYAPFRYARDFGRKNPSGAVLYLGMAAIMTFGFYRVAQGNLERRELKEEKKRARQNIIPFLQADDDIRYLAAKRAADAEEAKIMANVPGWEVGKNPYNHGWEPSAKRFPWS